MGRGDSATDGCGEDKNSTARSDFRHRHFRPGIAQSDRAIEYEPLGCRIRVEAKIALALELHCLPGLQLGKRGLDPGVGKHFERVWIDLRREIAGIGIRASKQWIVEPNFRRQ